MPARDVGRPRQDEEEVGKAVEIRQEDRRHLLLRRQGDQPAFRPSAHRPGQMQPCPRLAPSGKEERLQGRKSLFGRIDGPPPARSPAPPERPSCRGRPPHRHGHRQFGRSGRTGPAGFESRDRRCRYPRGRRRRDPGTRSARRSPHTPPPARRSCGPAPRRAAPSRPHPLSSCRSSPATSDSCELDKTGARMDKGFRSGS